VFAFFSDAWSLPLLIPDWIRFDILTPGPLVMQQGTHFDYAIRLHGVPFRWKSEISIWDPPHGFVDEQRRGPFRSWIHTHSFEEADSDRTIVRDVVRYGVPGGALVDRLIVEPKLRKIFAHRRRRLDQIFKDASAPES
jgi:ligand-binding SRPBCC domain-containing protein